MVILALDTARPTFWELQEVYLGYTDHCLPTSGILTRGEAMAWG